MTGAGPSTAWQPAEPAFWVLVVCIAVCTPLQLRDLAAQEASAAVLGISLIAALVEVAIFWALARLFLGGRRPPASLRLLALAWGLTVVPVIASHANTQYFGILNGLGLHAFAASIAAPIDEDLLRFTGTLGVLALASSRRISLLDGLVVGFLVGAGFEVSENLAFLLSSEDLGGTLQMALIRLGIGFGLHAFWTGLGGAALAYVLRRRQAGLPGRWYVAGLGLIGPMMLHAMWDAPSLSVSPTVVFAMLGITYGLTLAAFGVILFNSRRQQRRGSATAEFGR